MKVIKKFMDHSLGAAIEKANEYIKEHDAISMSVIADTFNYIVVILAEEEAGGEEKKRGRPPKNLSDPTTLSPKK